MREAPWATTIFDDCPEALSRAAGAHCAPAAVRSTSYHSRALQRRSGHAGIKMVLPRVINDNGRPVAKNLSNTGHNVGSVVTNPDYGIRTELLRVLKHEFEGVGARPLAEVRIQGDVAAKQRLEPGTDVSKDAA